MLPSVPVVSADSHVIEPPDLWTRRLPAAMRVYAPRLVEAPDMGMLFVLQGRSPVVLNSMTTAGRRGSKSESFSSLRAGGFDPEARLADAELDGVEAEILHPTAALWLFGAPDADYRQACFRVYNDWLAELCAAAPGRLFGLAALDTSDPVTAAEELQRGREAGLVGGLLPGRPPSGHYGEDRFEPLWKAAESAGTPLSIHAFSDRTKSELLNPGVWFSGASSPIHLVQLTLELLLSTGVFARHPGLRLVLSEFDAGWVPHFVHRLDSLAESRSTKAWPSDDLPSAVIRRHVRFGFQDDRVAIALRRDIGPSSLLWGSDYPHGASTWPNSRAILDGLFEGVPDDERAAITGGNAVALYGLSVARPASSRPGEQRTKAPV